MSLVRLPCDPPTWIEPSDVSSVRVQIADSEDGPVFVPIVSTTQGYSFGLLIGEDETAADVVERVAEFLLAHAE